MNVRMFSVWTPHGTFTRNTKIQYACISVWRKFTKGTYTNPIEQSQAPFAVWHEESPFPEMLNRGERAKNNVLLGIYPVEQLAPGEWLTKKVKKFK